MAAPCPCCCGTAFDDLVEFRDVPMSGVFGEDSASPIAGLDLGFELCLHCALVRQKTLARQDYVHVDRATTQQKPTHMGALLAELQTCGVRRKDFILEIGSNDGTFLDALRGAGFDNLVGVEPSRKLANLAQARGHKIENDYFASQSGSRIREKNGLARAIICRHTLEHVPYPAEFLAAAASALEVDGVLLLEVPDGAAIPDLMNLYELWDEHLYCFDADNLRMLVLRSGFTVRSISTVPHLDTRNIVMWCGKPHLNTVRTESAKAVARVSQWMRFAQQLGFFQDALSKVLEAVPRPIYFIGASHSQCNFANYLRLDRFVDIMIDDDPAKVGKVPPIRGGRARIVSTKDFFDTATAGTVVETGFGYPEWTERIRHHGFLKGLSIISPKPSIYLEQA